MQQQWRRRQCWGAACCMPGRRGAGEEPAGRPPRSSVTPGRQNAAHLPACPHHTPIRCAVLDPPPHRRARCCTCIVSSTFLLGWLWIPVMLAVWSGAFSMSAALSLSICKAGPRSGRRQRVWGGCQHPCHASSTQHTSAPARSRHSWLVGIGCSPSPSSPSPAS